MELSLTNATKTGIYSSFHNSLCMIQKEYERDCVNWGFDELARSIEPCQLAQYEQADQGQNILLLVNFCNVHGQFYLILSEPFTRQKKFSLVQIERFADKNFSMLQVIQYFFNRIEKIVGKGAFSPFPTMFSKGFLGKVDPLECDNSR